MISFTQARRRALAAMPSAAATEETPLTEAVGRVLATSPKAKVSHPPATVSAMDGYAIKNSDPGVRFTVVAVIAAGRGGKLAALAAGQAARVFTGGRLPPQADTVIPQEQAVLEGKTVRFSVGVRRQIGDFVRPKGADFVVGSRPLKAPIRITALTAALAAAMNYSRLTVYRRPRVALLASGDELLPPGHKNPGEGKLIASSAVGIKALLEEVGAVVVDLGRVRDDPERLLAKLRAARNIDLIITTGGVSVGERDAVATLLKSGRIIKVFNRVAMRPGKPMTLAYLQKPDQKIPWLGLPGNPVSSMLGALLLAVPMVEKFQGLVAPEFSQLLQSATLASPLAKNGVRTAFVRAKSIGDGDKIAALPQQDSAYLAPLAAADCLIVRPPNAAALKSGATVTALPICRTFWRGYPARPGRPR